MGRLPPGLPSPQRLPSAPPGAESRLPSGAATSFAAGFLKIRWALWAKLVIAGVTGFQAGLICLMMNTYNIWLCYGTFVLFRGAYQFLVPIAT